MAKVGPMPETSAVTPGMPSAPLLKSADSFMDESGLVDVVDVNQLASQMESYHRKRGGVSTSCVVTVIIINDIIILGLLAAFYYLCYAYSPGTIIPNAGLASVYLRDLALGDISLNATTMSTSRTDLPLALDSSASLNLTSAAGYDISLSTGSSGSISLNSNLVVRGNSITSSSASGLVLTSPSGISLSTSSAPLQLSSPTVLASGALSVGGSLSVGTLSVTGALTATGGISASGSLSAASISVTGSVSASTLTAAATLSAASISTATLTSTGVLSVSSSSALSVQSGAGVTLSAAAGASVNISAPVAVGSVTPLSGDTLVVSGGVRIPPTASFPSCTAPYRGMLRPMFGSTGSPDSLVVCAKNSSDLFGWQQVSYTGLVTRFVTDMIVAAGETISAGDAVSAVAGQLVRGAATYTNTASQFAASGGRAMSAAALTSTTNVAVYATSTQGFVLIGTLNTATNSYTYGAATVFDTVSIDRLTVSALSAGSFVIAYRDNTNNRGVCLVGTYSSGTLTLGTAATFASGGSPDFLRAIPMSATSFVLVYSKFVIINKYGTAIAGTVSGTSVTLGAEVTFNAAFTKETAGAMINSTYGLILYQSSYGTVVPFSLAGTVIALGTASVFSSTSQDALRIAMLTSSLFVITWSGTAQRGSAIVGTLNNGVASFALASEFNGFGGTEQIELFAASTTTFVIVYQSTQGYKTTAIVTGQVIGGSGIAYGPTATVTNDVASGCLTTGPYSSTSFFVGWCTFSTGACSLVNGAQRGGLNVLGVAQTSGVAGQIVPVIIAGVAPIYSGLTPGSWYFAQPSGTVATTFSNAPVGIALSATDLLLTQSTS